MWKTVQETADYLNLSSRTIWRRYYAGEYETKKVPNWHGGKDIVMIYHAELDTGKNGMV